MHVVAFTNIFFIAVEYSFYAYTGSNVSVCLLMGKLVFHIFTVTNKTSVNIIVLVCEPVHSFH